MSRHQKVAAIVWTVDPEGNKRFLLRHNKPFNGYEDEWTITFGGIEGEESLEEAAKREAGEEFGISKFEEVKNLNYKIEFDGKHGPTEAHFVALKVKNINVKIVLNEESIGYDWMKLEKVNHPPGGKQVVRTPRTNNRGSGIIALTNHRVFERRECEAVSYNCLE